MSKVVFIIDGWFMWKRIQKTNAFYYSGPEIRKYCRKHIRQSDELYRLFYYDSEPLDKKGHNPVTNKMVDFKTTPGAKAHYKLLESIRRTPNFALRLGRTAWQNNEWIIEPKKSDALIKKQISVDDLTEKDVIPMLKQKAVDMKMGLDIAWIAIKKLAELLIVITGDADIVPVLKFARREGMQVGLDPLRHPISPDLSEHVDFIATHIPPKPKP